MGPLVILPIVAAGGLLGWLLSRSRPVVPLPVLPAAATVLPSVAPIAANVLATLPSLPRLESASPKPASRTLPPLPPLPKAPPASPGARAKKDDAYVPDTPPTGMDAIDALPGAAAARAKEAEERAKEAEEAIRIANEIRDQTNESPQKKAARELREAETRERQLQVDSSTRVLSGLAPLPMLEGWGDEAYDAGVSALAQVPLFGLLAAPAAAGKSMVDSATGHKPHGSPPKHKPNKKQGKCKPCEKKLASASEALAAATAATAVMQGRATVAEQAIKRWNKELHWPWSQIAID